MRRFIGDALTACGIIVVAGWVIWQARVFPAGGGQFAIFSAVSVILLCLSWIVSSIWKPSEEYLRKIEFDFSFNNFKPILILALAIGYFSAIFYIGYFVTTTIFLLVAALVLGTRSYVFLILMTAGAVGFLYFLFPVLLGFNLPRGIFI